MAQVFKLGTFEGRDGKVFAGFVLRDEGPVYEIAEALTRNGADADTRTTYDFLQDWASYATKLGDLADAVGADEKRFADTAAPLAELKVYPPVWPLGELLQTGANYRSHLWQLTVAMEIGKGVAPEIASSEDARKAFYAKMEERVAQDPPVLFSGVRATIVGAYDDVILPNYAGRPDWELELGVVFGKNARNIKEADAYDYIAGYVISNDLSHRTLPKRMFPVGVSWLEMKNSPTFTPTGPYLVPARFVEDPMDLRIQFKLNGQIMQDESTGDMIYDIRKQIAYASQATVVRAGDMLLTGSPSGNGVHHKRFLQEGDVMEGTITGLGMQRNKVALEKA